MGRSAIRNLAILAGLGACIVACSQWQDPRLPPLTSSSARSADGRAGENAIAIRGIGNDPRLDKLVTAFMSQCGVPNAELAVAKAGTITFSHAYTNPARAISTTQRSTTMRLASLSKAWTSAALYNLIVARKIEPRWKVFQYLGITKPLPARARVDPRVYDITINDMILHESGWDDRVSHFDPTFEMRQIALALGLDHPIDQTQEVRYQLHEPLQEKPGTTYAYCNFCYTVLGMVVAKASGRSYRAYLTKILGSELRLSNVAVSPTVGARLPNEVAKYYNPYAGLSALYIDSRRKYPYPYSGDGMLDEVAQGAGGLETNADSMLVLMKHYIIWGVGTPPPLGQDWAREGEMPGTNTWAEQLPNGVHYAFLVNTNSYAYGTNPNAFTNLQYEIEATLQAH
ncbi:MAG: serine hydrolase [Candidatus Eremiobacteraeota bacterium]|nr:serine hydrolase [Candidatus Eremiobacteraeota bacterium]